MNIKTLKEALPYLFKANVATMLIGHHGVGKSQAVAQFAAENNMEFVDLRLGTQDVGDLLGLAEFQRDAKGNAVATKFMRPDWFPTNPDSKGIIFLDEINRARRDVLQAVFQLVLDKRLHRYVLPKGWNVIAAMNPNTEDYIVTDISDKAFMDRFCHIKLAPSRQEFFDYAHTKGFEPKLLQFLTDQPDLLQAELEAFDLSAIKPSRRSWEAVDRLIKVGTPINILNELTQGLVGIVAAQGLMKALTSENERPITADDVINNYDKHRKSVKKYSEAKSVRMDLLKFTADSILNWANANTKPLTPEQIQNLGGFLKDIPKDLSYALVRELFLNEYTRPVIESNLDLIKEIADKRGLKIDKLNKS